MAKNVLQMNEKRTLKAFFLLSYAKKKKTIVISVENWICYYNYKLFTKSGNESSEIDEMNFDT